MLAKFIMLKLLKCYFQTALAEYLKACHVQFCCVNSRTVLAANKLLISSSTQFENVPYTIVRGWQGFQPPPRLSQAWGLLRNRLLLLSFLSITIIITC